MTHGSRFKVRKKARPLNSAFSSKAARNPRTNWMLTEKTTHAAEFFSVSQNIGSWSIRP